MLDQIRIENLVVFANHGITPEEQQVGQKFMVSCTMYLDLHRAGRNDDLGASVNYHTVTHLLTEKLQEQNFQLIETAAEHLAKAVLTMDPSVQKVDIEIKKPWTPVALPLDSISVKITRSWHTAYIGIGSNLGDRKAYMDYGLKALQNTPNCIIDRVSSWMEAVPYGYTDQGNFLNGVIQMRTLLTPYALLDRIHAIEKETNHERLIHWGPRTLDLDILFYDNEIIQEEDLCIPHFDMKNRVFVLVPMAEIAPYFHHPVYGITIQEMLQDLMDRSK